MQIGPYQIKQMMIKFRSFIEDGNLEGLSATLSELETLEDTQEGYIVQLETEQMLLLSKIKELGQEIINSSPSLSRRSYSIGNWSGISLVFTIWCFPMLNIAYGNHQGQILYMFHKLDSLLIPPHIFVHGSLIIFFCSSKFIAG